MTWNTLLFLLLLTGACSSDEEDTKGKRARPSIVPVQQSPVPTPVDANAGDDGTTTDSNQDIADPNEAITDANADKNPAQLPKSLPPALRQTGHFSLKVDFFTQVAKINPSISPKISPKVSPKVAQLIGVSPISSSATAAQLVTEVSDVSAANDEAFIVRAQVRAIDDPEQTLFLDLSLLNHGTQSSNEITVTATEIADTTLDLTTNAIPKGYSPIVEFLVFQDQSYAASLTSDSAILRSLGNHEGSDANVVVSISSHFSTQLALSGQSEAIVDLSVFQSFQQQLDPKRDAAMRALTTKRQTIAQAMHAVNHRLNRIALADSQLQQDLVATQQQGDLNDVFTAEQTLVFGQPDIHSNRQIERGMNFPNDTFYAGNRLLVVDFYNHRVLVWNSAPQDNQRDTPDLVLGQPELSINIANNGGVSAHSLNWPHAVASSGENLIIADKLNHRVLIWNSFPTQSGQDADIVLGQADFVSAEINAGGLSATSLNAPDGITLINSRLIVSDTGNNRILIWNSLPTTHHQAADIVLGQATFATATANNGGVSMASLRSPAHLSGDANHLIVADQMNNRVLIWTPWPLSSGALAATVIGQDSATSTTANVGGRSAKSLKQPYGVAFSDPKLFVSDKSNNRVLIWNTLPTSNYQAADHILGQSSASTGDANPGGVNAATLRAPGGISVYDSNLYVADTSNNRVQHWQLTTLTNGKDAVGQLGQPNATTSKGNHIEISGKTLKNPQGIHSDGTRLFVADAGNNRVLVWNSINRGFQNEPDFILGQPDATTATMAISATKSASVFNPSDVHSDGKRLFVSASNRVLVWRTMPTKTNQAADFVLGQPTMTADASAIFTPGGVTASGLTIPYGMFSDGNRLAVADYGNNRVLIWTTMPDSTGQKADLVLGQSDMTGNSFNGGGSIDASVFAGPSAIYFDGDHFIVSDNQNSRILIWNSYPSQNSQAADLVLGQQDMVSKDYSSANLGAIRYPTGVYSDGTRLFVVDSMNSRIFVWDTFPTVNGQVPDRAFGQADLDSTVANAGGLSNLSFYQPEKIFLHGDRFFVADSQNHRIIVHPYD